jgi:hypothetical protein
MKTLFVLLFIFALSIASSCSFLGIDCGNSGSVDMTQRYFEILNVSTIKHISRESANGKDYVIADGESTFSYWYKGCQINFNMRYYGFETTKNNNGLLYACDPLVTPTIYSKEGFKKISVYTVYPWEGSAAGDEITNLMLFDGMTYDKFYTTNSTSTYTMQLNIKPKTLPWTQNTGQYLPYQLKVVFEMTDGKRIESISPRINFRL